MNEEELIHALEFLRNTMIAVATGGPRIDEVNDQYMQTFAGVEEKLAQRGIDNPITYTSLWDWYGRWSSGDLPTYQSRRVFVADLIGPLLQRIRTGRTEEVPPTGWTRVDRTVGRLRDRLAASRDEEDFKRLGCWDEKRSFPSLRLSMYRTDILHSTARNPARQTPSGCWTHTSRLSCLVVPMQKRAAMHGQRLPSRTPCSIVALRPSATLHCALRPQPLSSTSLQSLPAREIQSD